MLFSSEDQREDFSSNLETTPMVDVIFILLAFFVVVSQLKEHNISLKLPPAQAGKAAQSGQKSLLIQINGKNEVFYQDQKVNLEELEKILDSDSKKLPIQIRSDENSKSGIFLQILDLLKKYNFSQIDIAVNQKKSKSSQ